MVSSVRDAEASRLLHEWDTQPYGSACPANDEVIFAPWCHHEPDELEAATR